jgi:hypothetical protein
MPNAIRSFKGAFDGAVAPTITAIGDLYGEVAVEGPADHQVGNMASSNPDDHKHAEDDVANSGKPKVFEAFGKLGKH